MTENESSFVLALGNSPVIKLLDFFITFRRFDYSLTQIAENSGVSWATVCELVPRMKKSGWLIETRKVGNSRMFRLNIKNPVVLATIDYFNKICKDAVDKEILAEA